MRHEHDGEAEAGLHVLEPLLHGAPGQRIECGKRLVEQDDARVGDDRARQRHTLRLPSGQLVGIRVAEVTQAEGLERLIDDTWTSGSPIGRIAQAQRDILGHGQPWQQQRLLEDDPDVTAMGAGGNVHTTGVERVEPRDDPQQRALAAAAGTEEHEQLAFLNGQVEVLEDRELATPVAHATGGAAQTEWDSSHRNCTSVGACTGRNAASRRRRAVPLSSR